MPWAGTTRPGWWLDGLEMAAERHPNARFLLFGDQPTLLLQIAKRRRAKAVCTIRHAAETITNDTKAAAAVRIRQSSMRLAIDAVAAGEASGLVSAGNTGALLALGKIVLKSFAGDRPAGDGRDRPLGARRRGDA